MLFDMQLIFFKFNPEFKIGMTVYIYSGSRVRFQLTSIAFIV